MHLVVGSIQQETNTLNQEASTLADFDIALGSRMLQRIHVMDIFDAFGCTVTPTVYANAVPAGPLRRDDFEQLLSELLNRFPDGPVDGVWLYCHGAMEVESIGSGDIALLEAVRNKVGPDVPIAVALDFHANLDERMAGLANIVCGYRTAPHTDMIETERRAARLLCESITRHELPCCTIIKVPLILTGDKVITAEEPMRTIIRVCLSASSEPGVLEASVFNGQPWVDAPNTGASAVAIARTRAYRAKAQKTAENLARLLWESRDQYVFQAKAAEPERAIEQALTANEYPVFISDSGDNTTAGAPGRSVLMLELLLKHSLSQVLVAGITAPAVVAACRDHSPGWEIAVQASKHDELSVLLQDQPHSWHLRSTGNLLGWYGEDAGRYAVLSCPGLDILATERRCAVISPEIIASAGLDVMTYRIIVVKLGYLYPALAAIARQAWLALTPGASCEMIESIPYRRITRPAYPLDLDFQWQPAFVPDMPDPP